MRHGNFDGKSLFGQLKLLALSVCVCLRMFKEMRKDDVKMWILTINIQVASISLNFQVLHYNMAIGKETLNKIQIYHNKQKRFCAKLLQQ